MPNYTYTLIYIYIYIINKYRHPLSLHFVYILSSGRIDFMVSRGNWIIKIPQLIIYHKIDAATRKDINKNV